MSANSKVEGHTQGEWGLTDVGSTVYALGPDGYNTFFANVQTSGDFKLTSEDLRAIARLMSAAPDLLKALQDLLPYFEGEHHPDHPHVEDARAAIAKATGAQS